MAVRCAGDCRILENTGEKQDFEARLTRLRLLHEDVALRVKLTQPVQGGSPWGLTYTVTVTHVPSQTRIRYAGRADASWVDEFAADVAANRWPGPGST